MISVSELKKRSLGLPRPVIHVKSAQINTVQTITGVVTVGPESAALLSKKLGRRVEPGEQFDVGVLAYYHPNPIIRLWRSLIHIRRHLFSKPL